MFKNYLKSALRNLARRKGHAFINIAGLTLGLACCLIIFQYVAFEYSFDGFHENEGELYRVIQSTPLEGEAAAPGGAFTGFALAPALAESVPEIVRTTRVHPEYSSAIISSPEHPGRVFEEEHAFYVDPEFLEMFTFPLVAGNAARALEPGTILLSESAAQKYFGSANPIGKVLDVTGQIQNSYRVAGVFVDVPPSSHLEFDFLLPMEDLLRGPSYSNEPEGGWSWNNFITYVQLHPGADRAAADRKMTATYNARRGETLAEQGRTAHVWAQPLRDIHLNSEVVGPSAVMGSYRTVYFFIVIGLVTLLIALVNYVNLATARALDRAREVGVRKVVGAQRKQLILQFMFESALTNVAATVLAVGLAILLTPVVNDVAGTNLTGALWSSLWFWAAFLSTIACATLLAGLYPAFVLSSFKPAAVLKGKGSSLRGQLWLRKGLVVLQFAASVVLIGGTAVVYDQLQYMRGMDLGLDLEQVLTLQSPRILPESTDQATSVGTFLQELRQLPAVKQVATSSSLPGQGFNWNGASVRRAEEDPSSVIRGVVTYIDSSFADVYGLELVAGNGFADINIPEDEEAPWLVTANVTAVKTLGFESPESAVDHPLDIGGYSALIVGVYKDFSWTSAHEEQQNIFFGPTEAGSRISLRVSTADLTGTISTIKETYDSLFPGNVFNYSFIDDAFDQQYRNEERFATLFTFFAGLAVIIACLGLFGLASFTARQRTREIGLRKVLGASVPGLVRMLAQDFLKLVVVAVVIAIPVAYLLMQRWLNQFAFHVDVDLSLFLIVGAASLLIAFLTVAYQSVRAALTDPAKSLRLE